MHNGRISEDVGGTGPLRRVLLKQLVDEEAELERVAVLRQRLGGVLHDFPAHGTRGHPMPENGRKLFRSYDFVKADVVVMASGPIPSVKENKEQEKRLVFINIFEINTNHKISEILSKSMQKGLNTLGNHKKKTAKSMKIRNIKRIMEPYWEALLGSKTGQLSSGRQSWEARAMRATTTNSARQPL